MQANKTYAFMVTCQCPGHLGTARITVNYTTGREGYDFLTHTRDNLYSATACWACRKHFRIRELRGKYSARHECNDKCLSSKGPACECSCGGANHGASYALA